MFEHSYQVCINVQYLALGWLNYSAWLELLILFKLPEV